MCFLRGEGSKSESQHGGNEADCWDADPEFVWVSSSGWCEQFSCVTSSLSFDSGVN